MTDGLSQASFPSVHGPHLRWRIYYRDGSTRSSAQSTWEAAPHQHLVAVVWAYGAQPAQVEVGTPYYLNMGDWICRVWDPTLYLRKLGVKMGRWTTNQQFQAAWQTCLTRVMGKPCEADNQALAGGVVCSTRAAESNAPAFEWVLYYDDGSCVTGTDQAGWRAAPSDGVLAVYFHYVLNGILLAFGRRRFTFYYWKASGELENVDFLDECLPDFPQIKYGCPSFTAKSYTEQARAIAAAMADTLHDL